jgi:nicotinamidase-related amidase
VVEKAYGLEIPQSLEEACDPTRTALLVYDMQVGIIGQLKNGTEIVTRVRTVLDAARAAGLRVFFMRHLSRTAERSAQINFLAQEIVEDLEPALERCRETAAEFGEV